jgi:hypothetical protein
VVLVQLVLLQVHFLVLVVLAETVDFLEILVLLAVEAEVTALDLTMLLVELVL